jgi:2-amino-5-formylamino-6-ribosylaminopyrimidin-4(3H)-one 5'-monophosphate deformylase
MNRSDVGVIILGSQEERHGLLPTDTDTKLAAYVSFYAAAHSKAKLVGIINSAAEYSYIKHGQHFPTVTVIHDLKSIIENARDRLEITKFVVVNGHGGNKLIAEYLPTLAEQLGVKIAFNKSIVKVQGAHAASGECSMAVAAGVAKASDLMGQDDFDRFPEVGFIGMKQTHVKLTIKDLAEKTIKTGVTVDVALGKQLLSKAIDDVVKTINNLE